MTATKKPSKSNLPDFDGVAVDGSAITIAGVGATMGSTLAIETAEPIRKHDRVYVILEAECAKISFPDDKDGQQIRVAHLHPEDVYWADPAYAQKFIAEQREERIRREDEIAGQQRLQLEESAEATEARDETDAPDEIAAAAAKRAKQR